jgi:hypothetical protein
LIIFTTSGNQTGEGHLSPPVIFHPHEAMPHFLFEELAEPMQDFRSEWCGLIWRALKGHQATERPSVEIDPTRAQHTCQT